MRRGVGDLLGQFTRAVQIFHHQSAILSGRFDRDIADAEHSLPKGLDHPYVLYLGELNDAAWILL